MVFKRCGNGTWYGFIIEVGMTPACLSALQKALHPDLYAIEQYCRAHYLTVAVAESVTAGCLQLILSTAQHAQGFFQGGLTVYNSAQKTMHLQIEPLFAESCNGVDQGITEQLALNCCVFFRSQIGIGVTGFATKAPEMHIDKLYAHLAVAMGGKIICSDTITPQVDGIGAQWEYAAAAVKRLAECLESST